MNEATNRYCDVFNTEISNKKCKIQATLYKCTPWELDP